MTAVKKCSNLFCLIVLSKHGWPSVLLSALRQFIAVFLKKDQL
jgi:hypothetical protein